jgi:C4-type Zn-finger protein
MTASLEIATVRVTKPCPICDHHLELSSVETETWTPHTCAERLIFRCQKCGVTQTQWEAMPTEIGPPTRLWGTTSLDH